MSLPRRSRHACHDFDRADRRRHLQGRRPADRQRVPGAHRRRATTGGHWDARERQAYSVVHRQRRTPAEHLRDIVLTHCDIDHVGSVAELKRLTGARVAIHEIDAPVLAGERRSQKGGLIMLALYRSLRFRRVTPDLRLRDGDSISGLQVMDVPGHTGGSIALVRADGVVFSGDALRVTGTATSFRLTPGWLAIGLGHASLPSWSRGCTRRFCSRARGSSTGWVSGRRELLNGARGNAPGTIPALPRP